MFADWAVSWARTCHQLSKGFRQRVGLAQAILRNPQILILDEPTSGLDPNQQQEVRNLIQTLKHKKTVLLSTHILSEAHTSCDRVLIIHKGKIVADAHARIAEVSRPRSGNRLRIELKAPAAVATEQAISKQIPRSRSGNRFQKVLGHRSHFPDRGIRQRNRRP